jgi:hypothetical protein
MDRAIVMLSDKVMQCAQNKAAPASECFCLYPRELSRVKKTYEETLSQRPGWADRTVSYAKDGKTYAVSFGGLKQQLERNCSGPR